MPFSEQDFPQVPEDDSASTNPVVLAMKPLGTAGVPEIEDAALRLRAGVWGIILGAIVFPIGVAIGSLLTSAIFGAGEHRVPRFVFAALFCLAVWGGLMFLVGWLRVLQGALRRDAVLAAMVVLPVMAIGYLWVLMMLFVR